MPPPNKARTGRSGDESSRAAERDGPHRGRDAAEVFARFEDVDPRSVLGGGDVKYHMGATGDFLATNGRKVAIHLVSNPEPS